VRERKFALPDPSKKQQISQDTPIRVNPTGQYNLNFIDWNNEWEAILERDPYTYESPIDGIDAETFEAIFDEEMFDAVKEAQGVSDSAIARLDTRTVNKVKKDNMCAICTEQYKRGEKVFFLGCKHHYHTICILPWLQKNHACPTCRYDISKQMPANQAAEEDDFENLE